ncbi:hypothetical protein [uncultured Helicobacter sp.]|nr:hypothetical protein [uncultured Helicobacter sp.]
MSIHCGSLPLSVIASGPVRVAIHSYPVIARLAAASRGNPQAKI